LSGRLVLGQAYAHYDFSSILWLFNETVSTAEEILINDEEARI
jgi:hypothetical protein